MKTTLPIFLLLIMCVYHLMAQDFAPIGAKWHFNETSVGSNSVDFTTYESIGDTVIDNLPCRVIYKEKYSCCIDGGSHFIHQRNDSILLFNPITEAFELIFNFGADVGDSWTLRTHPGGELLADSAKCVVDSISYFHYSATDSLKILHVSLKSYQYLWYPYGDTITLNTQIIEKIGFSSSLLLRDCLGFCDANFDGVIRCYEDSDVGLITFSSVACEYTTVKNTLPRDEIVVYPNPTKDKIYIGNHTLSSDCAKLFSSEGTQIFVSIQNNVLDVKSLDAGIYYLSVQTEKGLITKK